MPMDSLKEKVIRGSFAKLIAQAGSVVLRIVALVVLARMLAPEDFGGPLLQAVDRRVLAIDVIADLGVRHRATHLGRRLGDGIAAEIGDCGANCFGWALLFGRTGLRRTQNFRYFLD